MFISASNCTPRQRISFLKGLAGFGDVYREGWAIPVDDYIADSTLISQDDFIASAFNACSHEGKQFGTPHRQDVRTWFYRKSYFEEAGVTEVPGTWDEQLEAAVKATKRENDVLIQAGDPPFPGGGGSRESVVHESGLPGRWRHVDT